jgi:hypothetical protein
MAKYLAFYSQLLFLWLVGCSVLNPYFYYLIGRFLPGKSYFSAVGKE